MIAATLAARPGAANLPRSSVSRSLRPRAASIQAAEAARPNNTGLRGFCDDTRIPPTSNTKPPVITTSAAHSRAVHAARRKMRRIAAPLHAEIAQPGNGDREIHHEEEDAEGDPQSPERLPRDVAAAVVDRIVAGGIRGQDAHQPERIREQQRPRLC